MMNETILKFGYPETLLAEYEHWVVLLRPKQVTAGAMVLACKESAASMPEVSAEAFSELSRVTGGIEASLAKALGHDKINYVLLMMVDKEVHFHVIPRYETPRELFGVTFEDPGWPKHPAMTQVTSLSSEQFSQLHSLLKSNWAD